MHLFIIVQIQVPRKNSVPWTECKHTCLELIRASQYNSTVYAHARIHSHTTHSWNADMPAHAPRRSVTDIYIYTHRESRVHNHEPRVKALGNSTVYAHARIHSHTTHSWNADMPAHARRSVTDIYIYS